MRPPIQTWNGEERLERAGAPLEQLIANDVERLRAARPLKEFARIVSRMERRLPYEVLMAGNRGKPWREAWIALNFGVARSATHLQLAAAGLPGEDFYMKRADEAWYAFEATEAMLPGRKRDEEVKANKPEHGQVIHLEDCDIRRESDGALPALVSALQKKARTSRGDRLVVYWNTGWLIGAADFIDGLKTQTAPFRGAFAEAWIMGKASLFRVAPDFAMVQGPPTSLGAKSTTRALDELYE
ncbi:MAG: hypothetical protein IT547_04585 [Hyphomonadaceae bacterium]|nr:hypothetical protein [Hyphomonadaceae bacterium]